MIPLRRHFLPLTFWSVLCALFFATLLLGQERLPSGDFTGQFHAFGLFQARELTAGRFPVWSPGSFAGFPFAADSQAAAFYPPRLLTILLAPSFPLLALEIEVIVHVWLAGLLTYVLAYEITQRRAAALIAAISFGVGGYLTSYPLLQVALLESIIWLPLVLWLLKRAVSGSAGQHSALSTQSSVLKKQAWRAIKVLHRFNIGKPGAWLCQGWYEQLRGRTPQAMKLWQKGLDAAASLKTPYEEGLLHYHIARHLPANDPARAHHLAQAHTLFTRLETSYELALLACL